jgi:uncharacterized protein YqgQ
MQLFLKVMQVLRKMHQQHIIHKTEWLLAKTIS